MFSKLAFRNVKKSIRDYMVYFLTLMLGVCIFYVFNSIEAQSSMMDIKSADGSVIDALILIIDIVSVLVSVVMAFLIIYANKFMIKRRKKELGIYMTLGMPQSAISGMLVLETLIIGVLALAVGLVLGVFLSQGLAVVTAKLFEVNIVDFHFIFSTGAFVKSILYFGVIFLVVMIFNSASISKCKLIDLLYADRKNEVLRLRKTGPSIALFIAGVALIAISYYLVIRGGAGMIMFTIAPALATNIGGTLLFFMSLSGFLIKSVQANKKMYFKGLNMFVLRQLASKVNTNFVSMTFICTMLFLTIVILSTVTSFNAVFNAEAELFTPYDISITIAEGNGGANTTVAEQLPKVGIDEDELFSQKYEYNIYNTEVRMTEIAQPYTEFLTEEAAEAAIEGAVPTAIRLSDYNALMEMRGKGTISLAGDEFAVIAMHEAIKDGVEAYLETTTPIDVNGTLMTPAPGIGALTEGLWTTNGGYADMTLILPDAITEGFTPSFDVYVANYAPGVSEETPEMAALPGEIRSFEQNSGIAMRMASKAGVSASHAGLTNSMIFVGIYMGLIFLIAGAAILALQQLSEAADSQKRYSLLRKLGTEDKMIDSSIFAQVGLYFFIPLILAAAHSAVGMWVMNQGIIAFGKVDVMWSAVLAALFIAFIYGSYFLATYFGCKNIARAKDLTT